MVSVAKWREAMLRGLQSLLIMCQQNIDFEIIFKANLGWIFGQQYLSDPNNIESFKQFILTNPYPQTLANQERQFKVLEQFDSRDQLKLISAPTLVIYGKEDLLSLQFEDKYLAKNIKEAKFSILPGAHLLWLESPDILANTIITFLKN